MSTLKPAGVFEAGHLHDVAAERVRNPAPV
jgi:hypothetical protein